jgi:hypothetical protein
MDPITIEYLADMLLNPHHKNWEGGTLVEHVFLSCMLAQQVRCYVANIIWQLFAKRGNIGPQKSFSMMQCLLDQAICKTLKPFSHICSFLRSGLPWKFGSKWNDLDFDALQWRVEKSHQGALDSLLDYERIKCQHTLTNFGKARTWPIKMFLRNLIWFGVSKIS